MSGFLKVGVFGIEMHLAFHELHVTEMTLWCFIESEVHLLRFICLTGVLFQA